MIGEIWMTEKLLNRRSITWISVQAALENSNSQWICCCRKLNDVALIDDGIQLFDRVSDFVERRIFVNQVVKNTPQRPDIRFSADLQNQMTIFENLEFVLI